MNKQAVLFGLVVTILLYLLLTGMIRQSKTGVIESVSAEYGSAVQQSVPPAQVRAVLERVELTVEDRISIKLEELGRSDLEQLALRIAYCESRFDPNAKNSMMIGSERASGLFQFLPSTWRTVSNGDIWSVEDQTEAFVTMVGRGRIREWACK